MKGLVDDDGENRAVRAFLSAYGVLNGMTTGQMRKHLTRSGFPDATPEWAKNETHLTKAGAQLWLRQLFALEQPAQPVAEVVWDGINPNATYIKFLPAGLSLKLGDKLQKIPQL